MLLESRVSDFEDEDLRQLVGELLDISGTQSQSQRFIPFLIRWPIYL